MKRAIAVLVLCAGCARGPQTIVVRFAAEHRGVSFRAEVARTVEEKRSGLMGRASMAVDRGMLFVWTDVAPRTFWMKDTLIALDLVSIRAGRVVGISPLIPCRAEPCPITRTPPADAALEINAGQAARTGISLGNLVEAPGLK